MKKTFAKSAIREVAHSVGRFIAIVAIVALGVGILTGLLSTTPAMKKSVDAYYDGYHAADLTVKAGGMDALLTPSDAALAAQTEGVQDVLPLLSVDQTVGYQGENPAARILAYEFALQAQSGINGVQLLQGSLPQSKTECLVERGGTYLLSASVGDEIEVRLAMGGVAVSQTYTVSGVVGNCQYFYKEREPVSVGDGKLGLVLYLDLPSLLDNLRAQGGLSALAAAYLTDKYTDLAVTVTGAQEKNAFTQKYDDVVDPVATRLKQALGEDRYVLTRDQSRSFAAFDQNADKVAAIAVIFPAFFFLVAALVSLTTMTRMIEQQRVQIGALKALGYGKGTILLKYVLYCALAGALGCVAGVLLGWAILPSIIWSNYAFLFHLPKLVLPFNWLYASVSSLSAMASILVATVWAGVRTLREKPAQLLLPKAPKPGKKILLERTPLWRLLRFRDKSTIRNLFRYKKHFLMTVIGIGGCTALIVTALGLNDSMHDVTDRQFTEIVRYALSVTYTGDPSDELSDLLDTLTERRTVLYTESGDVEANGKKVNVRLAVPQNAAELGEYVRLSLRRKKAPVFTDDSLILTQRAAIELGVKAGDDVRFTFDDGTVVTGTLTGLSENYVGGSLYAGKNLLAQLPQDSEKDTAYNTLWAFASVADDERDGVTRRLLAAEGVEAVGFTQEDRDTYAALLQSLGALVAVLVLCAGGLAVIVLYNLININIDERSKELATLKVLGYTGAEVAGYVLREIVVMTVVGIAVGLLLGWGLHTFAVSVADTVDMMLARHISSGSYLGATGLTVLFSAIVDGLMCIKLKKIDMIESMKAGE